MRDTAHTPQDRLISARRTFCLTNLSAVHLIGCSIGASIILWICIWAVL